MPEPRFLVVRLGSLGDIVHTFPAVAALREQLSANHLLSSSSLSPELTSRRRRIFYRISTWVKWLAWAFLKQVLVDASLLFLFILWARWKGYKDRRVEEWVRRRWRDVSQILTSLNGWLRGTTSAVGLPGSTNTS